MTGNGNTISYKYNDSGIRTQKTVNDITTNYHLVGDKVTYEDNGIDKIYYTYDASGQLVSMSITSSTTPDINGEYYYIRNAQGDIIGLFDGTETQIASYSYDSWGKLISIKDGSGVDITNDTESIGYKNPYRYRGYRYDTETGLYYLQSRYYNPEWGRFINADGIIGQTGELLVHNLFAYCKNNPVNMKDENGFRPIFSASLSEETDEMKEVSLAIMNNRYNYKSGYIKKSFDYKTSAKKGTISGSIDKIGEVASGTFIKEKKVWKSFNTLTLGKYVNNLSKGIKFSKKALGVAGTVGFVAWDLSNNLIKGECVGAGIDVLSAVAGLGAGVVISLGTAAVVTAGTPALLMSGIGFGVCVITGVYIDKISSGIKDRYYGG
ncbi:hypothetical protein BGI42_06730 [Clostridium taeniosporum]|uniref:RHS repeat-associated core domain-containing protein n=2 Tax=Clostridium taeniosporum TaxID=394958 RepID=A0A1D7XJE0_9CLOT|nr:hypothetical protein BGI42_06730 [Clostridium taeniosporum]